jgi:hypothetical protein
MHRRVGLIPSHGPARAPSRPFVDDGRSGRSAHCRAAHAQIFRLSTSKERAPGSTRSRSTLHKKRLHCSCNSIWFGAV